MGYRLANDLWIEAGFTSFSTTRRESSGGYAAEYRNAAYAASVLVRTRLAVIPRTSPWAVDVVGGLVRLSAYQELTSYSQGIAESSSHTGMKDVQLDLGIGGRYRLSRHWQLTADAQAQLSAIGLVINAASNNEKVPLGYGAMVGVRYAF
ncbi:MAG: hypothetical protein ACRYFR_15525 [Janthinobacterium lividum]